MQGVFKGHAVANKAEGGREKSPQRTERCVRTAEK